ncbi:MAG TPA: hypothetical protein VH880_07440 [Anaeromyxobacteraceae bacterium]|jgi:hypothetical protein
MTPPPPHDERAAWPEFEELVRELDALLEVPTLDEPAVEDLFLARFGAAEAPSA